MTLSNYAELVLVSDLADRMVDQMDMIYNYFIHDTVYTGDEWNAAKKLFNSSNELPSSSKNLSNSSNNFLDESVGHLGSALIRTDR